MADSIGLRSDRSEKEKTWICHGSTSNWPVLPARGRAMEAGKCGFPHIGQSRKVRQVIGPGPNWVSSDTQGVYNIRRVSSSFRCDLHIVSTNGTWEPLWKGKFVCSTQTYRFRISEGGPRHLCFSFYFGKLSDKLVVKTMFSSAPPFSLILYCSGMIMFRKARVFWGSCQSSKLPAAFIKWNGTRFEFHISLRKQ